jgi:hypothetical protein
MPILKRKTTNTKTNPNQTKPVKPVKSTLRTSNRTRTSKKVNTKQDKEFKKVLAEIESPQD